MSRPQKEGFKWCTPRDYTVPVITRPDGTLITEKQLQKELGFFLVEVGQFRLKDTAADVERYLQTYLFENTGDFDDDGFRHRRLGVQLHKGLVGDFGEYCHRELWTVFVAMGPLTKFDYDLDFKDPKRLDVEFNGVPAKMVKGNKRYVPKKSIYLIDGKFNPPSRRSYAKIAKAKRALEEDAGVTSGVKKSRAA